MIQPAGERIAALEQHMVSQDEKLNSIVFDIKDIKLILEKNGHLEDKVNGLQERIDQLQKSSNLWRWLAPTLSSVFTAGVTFLLIQYLQNIK